VALGVLPYCSGVRWDEAASGEGVEGYIGLTTPAGEIKPDTPGDVRPGAVAGPPLLPPPPEGEDAGSGEPLCNGGMLMKWGRGGGVADAVAESATAAAVWSNSMPSPLGG
jgi:hypothetical protein